MHGHDPHFLETVAPGLGWYYLILGSANLAVYFRLALRGEHISLREMFRPAVWPWLAFAAFFLIAAPLAMGGRPLAMPEEIKDWVDSVSGPVSLTVGSLAVFAALFVFRKFFVQPIVAGIGLNLALLLMGMSMTDADFFSIVGKPDNVPIVGLVFLLGFFTWLATYRAVQNDERAKQGLPSLEAVDNEKVLVWPDLVYTELICMVALTALLLVWAIVLKAPLEDPASSVKTPNPSKAPWYFLGLQEMLVYFDPWMAGVVLPSMVIVGLMAIPYLDFNKQGNGYYTISERPFAYLVFQFGFFELWVVLIILGTFLRGPNWNFFGPYEAWDPHKVLALNNINLSEYFWIFLMNMDLPRAPEGAGTAKTIFFSLYREWPGIVLIALYLGVTPLLLATTIFRNFFVKMGFIRYMVMVNLLLMMGLLPLKMVLRWTVNLKYFISIPEWGLNL